MLILQHFHFWDIASNLCTVFTCRYVLHMHKSCVIECNVPLGNIYTYLTVSNISYVHMYVRTVYVRSSSLPLIDGVATLGVGIGGGHGPEAIVP